MAKDQRRVTIRWHYRSLSSYLRRSDFDRDFAELGALLGWAGADEARAARQSFSKLWVSQSSCHSAFILAMPHMVNS
jgi:hypothetical protein